MLKASAENSEKLRLQALKEYNILDSPPELTHDEITKIAAYICNTPVSLISLIDTNRQWFKSKFGFGVSETPRNISFCNHAIYENDIFIIEDATKDERFNNNPLVISDPYIKFYAGAQLRTPKGITIGTLCVIDYKPNHLNETQIEILKSLSKHVINFFELRLKNARIIENERKLITHAKLNSLGEMASGIAHEINNPLAIISGKIELITFATKSSNNLNISNLQTDLIKISAAIERISKIIKGLQHFAKNSDEDKFEFTPLNNIISNVLDLIYQKFSNKNIHINLKINSDQIIYCRQSQISHVFMNLFLNSYDALENSKNKKKLIKIYSERKENTIKIYFIDNGNGIPKENVDRIMEPFFTTKEIGQGIGLGLSMCKGIIEEHNGNFYVDINHKETCFVIELPIIK
ncbi:GAF domain-containing sensor histidine kinase [Spirobacillus cienkowskii]|uniref:GAF domain-containing sensor histidine kinase n=1 Tax=Spirobacillus cienkowskii TaxID=495820 RepID=UPI0030D5798B